MDIPTLGWIAKGKLSHRWTQMTLPVLALSVFICVHLWLIIFFVSFVPFVAKLFPSVENT